MHSFACACAVVFRESVVVGETHASPEEVQQIVQNLGDSFRGTSYHLLQRNCNHFSDMLCERLTGHPAPVWVSSSCLPCMQAAQMARFAPHL